MHLLLFFMLSLCCNVNAMEEPAWVNFTLNVADKTADWSENKMLIKITQSSEKPERCQTPIKSFNLQDTINKWLQSNRINRDRVKITVNVEKFVEYFVIKKEYSIAQALCDKCNLNVLSFLCARLAELTVSLRLLYGQFYINERLKGNLSKSIFVVGNNTEKRYVTDSVGGKTWIWDISKKNDFQSLPTTNYCCLIENREEVMQLIDFIKEEYWGYNNLEKWAQDFHSMDQGYVPALFNYNFITYLKTNGDLQ